MRRAGLAGAFFATAAGLAVEKEFRVFAICRKAGLTGIEYAEQQVPIVEGETKTATAHCPGGTQAISGGPGLTDGPVHRSLPIDDSDRNRKPDDGWRVTGKRGPGGDPDVILSEVTCLDSGRGEVEYVRERGKIRGGRPRSLKATCPRSKSVVGGGWLIRGIDNFAHSTKPVDSKADRRKVPDDRWEATLVNDGGGRRNAAVQAICVG